MVSELDTAAYDFPLDPALIAQHPPPTRSGSRLLILDRNSHSWKEIRSSELPELLRPTDLLVLNDTRVRAARLIGQRPTGGKVDVLLTGNPSAGRWTAMIRAARKLRPDERLVLEGGAVEMTVIQHATDGYVLSGPESWSDVEPHGRAPLPPYIRREGADDAHRTDDLDRYQTVYAGPPGAIAAPTAGLHLTEGMIAEIRSRGVEIARVTLAVGLGTFLPVKTDRIDDHPMHAESYEVSTDAAEKLTQAHARDGRIVAVGTTSCRVIETLARQGAPPFREVAGETRLFIHPPDRPRVVGAMLTNFHLPKSTLLMLISAMAGRELVLDAYAWAQANGFRFYSYGDAMLII